MLTDLREIRLHEPQQLLPSTPLIQAQEKEKIRNSQWMNRGIALWGMTTAAHLTLLFTKNVFPYECSLAYSLAAVSWYCLSDPKNVYRYRIILAMNILGIFVGEIADRNCSSRVDWTTSAGVLLTMNTVAWLGNDWWNNIWRCR